MNKTDFLKLIAKECGKSSKEISNVFQAFETTLKEILCKGESVAIAGFGKFFVKDRASVRKVNPITKRFYYTKPQKVTTFKAYKNLKLCVK